jgi:hypothetical protein
MLQISKFARQIQLKEMCLQEYHFLARFAGQMVFNKDPTFWLDGAKPPPKYVCKYIKLRLLNRMSMI